ncbi:SAM-dependent methyltransferase [Saccharopolyspora sp. NPDC047091]|uniref:SAM-dependent methyltransferase n=1 Tax=Saccharopolyspora sp. NPDC047091 TaxID=3155924 RepID=UPI0033DE5B6B
MSDLDEDPFPPQHADLTKPSVARVYDWYLGGNANWAIDREFGQHVVDQYPLLRPIAISNRLFLHRAVRHLVSRGVHQFIDIGSGVPTMGNTHSVADEVEPGSKVVYVDHEPVAVAHSQVLLEKHGDPERHAAINADFRNPDRLWQKAIETGVLDLEQPVAVLLIAVLHVQQPGPDGEDISPQVMKRYRELLPPGSFLALSHLTDDGVPSELDEQLVGIKQMYDNSSSPVIWRSQQEIRALFGDFEMLEPGMAWTTDWHPEDSSPNHSPKLDFSQSGESAIWAGVGRKPF